MTPFDLTLKSLSAMIDGLNLVLVYNFTLLQVLQVGQLLAKFYFQISKNLFKILPGLIHGNLFHRHEFFALTGGLDKLFDRYTDLLIFTKISISEAGQFIPEIAAVVDSFLSCPQI